MISTAKRERYFSFKRYILEERVKLLSIGSIVCENRKAKLPIVLNRIGYRVGNKIYSDYNINRSNGNSNASGSVVRENKKIRTLTNFMISVTVKTIKILNYSTRKNYYSTE